MQTDVYLTQKSVLLLMYAHSSPLARGQSQVNSILSVYIWAKVKMGDVCVAFLLVSM